MFSKAFARMMSAKIGLSQYGWSNGQIVILMFKRISALTSSY